MSSAVGFAKSDSNISLFLFLIFRLFGTKCDKCGSSFSKNDFVMRAKTKIYHIECFRCSACTRQLIPGKICLTLSDASKFRILKNFLPLQPVGDEFALRDGGALYCKEDHDHLEKSNQNSLIQSVEPNNNISSNTNQNSTSNNNNNNNTSLSNNNHSSELGSMSGKFDLLS